MQVIITKQFEKDVEKELTKPLQIELASLITQMQDASSLREIPNLKKLHGYKSAFRIKFGEFSRLSFGQWYAQAKQDNE